MRHEGQHAPHAGASRREAEEVRQIVHGDRVLEENVVILGHLHRDRSQAKERIGLKLGNWWLAGLWVHVEDSSTRARGRGETGKAGRLITAEAGAVMPSAAARLGCCSQPQAAVALSMSAAEKGFSFGG